MSRRRTFRLLAGFVATGLAASLVAATGGAAMKPADLGAAKLHASYYTPMSLRTDTVTAIVELAADPIAEVQASKAQPLSPGEVSEIRSELQASQNAVKPAIRAAGGRVRSDYQNAYNGISVRIARNKVADLRSLPGVVGVHILKPVERSNAVSVPYLGVPTAWSGPHFWRGAGQKIAIIDTGIDYTHGTSRSRERLPRGGVRRGRRHGPLPANPALFGPGAAKVKGGIDLVGDDYNATRSPTATSPYRTRTRTRSTATATARTSPAPQPGFGVTRQRQAFTRPL